MYSLSAYGSMIKDRIRTDAYAQALRQTIKPGAVVLDIGTGSGILALLACRFGARKVYAIEPDDIIEVAREIARANGYADRIEFIQDRSTRVTLPERADIVVSDLRGLLPLFQQSVASLLDVRRRLLAPGGAMIPQRDTLWAATVEAPGVYRDLRNPWEDNSYGFDMRAARVRAMNSFSKSSRIASASLLTAPESWATLDYRVLESVNACGEVKTIAVRSGVAHGWAVWFDTVFADGIGFSNAPDLPEAIYGRTFFPWSEPVCVNAGDFICGHLRADVVGDEYVWSWDTTVADGEGQIKASFRQSSFYGDQISLGKLKKRAPGFLPATNDDGEVLCFALRLMNGSTPLEGIANQVRERFPSRFTTPREALSYLGGLSEVFSR